MLVKYSDRGLVNDRYYYNMDISLFKILFWIINVCCLAANQGMLWSFLIKHGQSFFLNSYRYIFVINSPEKNQEMRNSKELSPAFHLMNNLEVTYV